MTRITSPTIHRSEPVTLPFLLLLLDFWPFQRFQVPTPSRAHSPTLRLLVEKLPFFAVAAASCVVTFLVQRQAYSVATDVVLPVECRLNNVAVSYVKYLGLTVWPVNLAIFYPHPDLRFPAFSTQWPGWQIALAASLLVAVSAAA